MDYLISKSFQNQEQIYHLQAAIVQLASINLCNIILLTPKSE